MLLRVDAQPLLHGFIQTPADIIVAAQIVHEPAVVRQGVEGIHCLLYTSVMQQMLKQLTRMLRPSQQKRQSMCAVSYTHLDVYKRQDLVSVKMLR